VDSDGDGYWDDHEVTYGDEGAAIDPNSAPADINENFIPDVLEQENDSDLDGVLDLDDNCKNDPNPKSDWTDIDGVQHTDEQPDYDLDGVGDACDNCPNIANGPNEDNQLDTDSDNVGDVCDNAPNAWNPGQEDTDEDGIPDVLDNCPQVPNPKDTWTDINGVEHVDEQPDYDLDGMGDICDDNNSSTKPGTKDPKEDPPPPDDDEDGIINDADNCPVTPNANQLDTDKDGEGDACDNDDDGDGVPDTSDNCPLNPNPDQADSDGNGVGDVCDPDDDGDGILDTCDADNNPGVPDTDEDNIIDTCDNCPLNPNPDQADSDGNGVGDVCEPEVRIKFTLTDPDDVNATYDTWLPEPDRRAIIHATLEDLSGTPISGTIELTMVDILTSQLPGKYTNHDPNAADYDTNPDYEVISGEETDTITISCHDYLGSTVISAQATYSGGTVSGEVMVPKDTDKDGIPDHIENDSLLDPADSFDPLNSDSDGDGILDKDEDQEGKANQDPGDGLKFSEEARGVLWNGAYYRLSAGMKDLFVCGVDYAANNLDFAVGAAFQNAGIDAHLTETVSTGDAWFEYEKNFEDQNLDVLIIRAYPDEWHSSDPNKGHINWLTVKTYDISVLGWSNFGDSLYYGEPCKVYATSIENYLNDRPYKDLQTLTNPGASDRDKDYDPQGNGMLDPLENVEDQSDDGQEDNKEDANKNLIFEGDRVEMDVNTWGDPNKLNPFNIDNDAYVELPQVKGDPNSMNRHAKVDGEYDKNAVVIHVTTHEIGHSIGMREGDSSLVDSKGHCFDEKCVMYYKSKDWKRQDYFCPFHESQSRIHNNVLND
jgi:hypothetical protein